ncbi:MAG: response regulator, partial [Alphaproteobacteria bacterium]|nr:response regulator [Alphaproteobacteria bacterium]
MDELKFLNARQMRILVVDDQPFIRQIVRDALVSVGVGEVTDASSGADAIQQIRGVATADSAKAEGVATAGFACVITDFNMKPLNGIHVLKSIRTGSSGAPRDTPVVILTGHSDDRLVAAGRALDANGYVVKPVSRDELLSRVIKATNRSIDLKSAEEYGMVEVPEPTAANSAMPEPAHDEDLTSVVQDVPDATDQDATLIPVDDIEVGYKLAADVRDPEGNVVMRKGKHINPILLRKLTNLRLIEGIATALWVWR